MQRARCAVQTDAQTNQESAYESKAVRKWSEKSIRKEKFSCSGSNEKRHLKITFLIQ
jgi:hypothetical protein